MNRITNFSKLILLISSSFLFACANMVNPSGGLKDVDPPELVKSKPKIYSTNFTGKKIELTFNEYLNLKEIQKQLIVSPSDIEIEVKKTGKILTLQLDKTPQINTTFIVNFGDAISDYTENNITKDFKYIFSTGPEIDSLEISGIVIDAIKKEKVKEAIVCLYNSTDDSIVYKRKPDYTVRTNENGIYKFTNLKSSTYKIFCLKETNNNKIFDSQDEEIAFNDTLIELKQNSKINPLIIFTEKPQQRKLLNKSFSYNKAELIFNKKNDIELVSLDKSIDTIIYSTKKDTILAYYKNMPDTSFIYLSENNKLDTIQVKFPKSSKKSDFNISVENKILNKNLLIKSNDLFKIKNLDSLTILEDSIKIKYNIKQISYNIFSIEYDFNKEKNYLIKLADSVFQSYTGNYNKPYSSKINFYKEEELGTLTINNIQPNKIYELLNERLEVVRRTIHATESNINYKNIFPGSYTLRIISDDNKNKIWDTGNYLKHIQPEKIEYYTNPIKVRANWDLEIQLIKP